MNAAVTFGLNPRLAAERQLDEFLGGVPQEALQLTNGESDLDRLACTHRAARPMSGIRPSDSKSAMDTDQLVMIRATHKG